MSFKTENRRISDVFQRQAKYIVPRYQRSYVWGKVNWKELYTDIVFTMENKEAANWSHFLGTIVLNEIDTDATNVDGISKYEIIDGQQRLMTLYVLIAVCYKRFLCLNTDAGKKRADDYIRPTFLESRDTNGQSVAMIQNDDCQDSLLEVLQCSQECGTPANDNPFRSLFIFFDTELKDYDFDQLTEFFNKTMSASIVEIISDKEEEIYNIFEVLNARGQKLKMIELLKNHVLKYLQPREQDFIDQAKKKWNAMASLLEQLPDSDDFINHFAKVYIRKRPENKSETYRLIKEEVAIENLSLFLQDISDFSVIYCELLNSDDVNVKYFIIKNNKQIRPLLASIERLYRKEIISDETKTISFRTIRNYFFQFNIARLSSNKTDECITQAAYDIYHCSTEVHFKFIITNLCQKLSKYLNPDVVENSLFANPSLQYSNKKGAQRTSRLVRYILLEYCGYYQTDSEINPERVNIEHLQVDSGNYDSSQLWNLTLTTPEINQRDLSTHDVVDKVNLLGEKSTIRVNQMLCKYVRDGEFDFEARKQDMLNVLLTKIFLFDAIPYGISQQDVEQFIQCEGIVKNDSELLTLLHQTGVYFVQRLEKDPKLSELYMRYQNARQGSSI